MSVIVSMTLSIIKSHFIFLERYLISEFEKWRAIRASVGGVLAWVSCLRGCRARMGGVLTWVTWLAC